MTAVTARTARAVLPWLALAALLAVALGVAAARSAPDDSPAARARRLARELRCPVCQGLSVADSNEESSRNIRADIERRIAAGQADGEIRQAYVDRYGETILLRPEGEGIGVLVWGLPAALLVVGAGGLVLLLRRWSREPRLAATADDEALVAREREARR